MSFEEVMKVTETPEHETLVIPSLRKSDFSLVVIVAVAEYVTPAWIEIH